MKNSNS